MGALIFGVAVILLALWRAFRPRKRAVSGHVTPEALLRGLPREERP